MSRFLVVLAFLVGCRGEPSNVAPDEAPKKRAQRTTASVSQEVPIDIPKAMSGGEIIEVLAVHIDAAGKLWTNGAPIKDEAELEAKAKAALEKNKDVRAVVAADSTVPYGRVITVLDRLKMVGVSKISLGVGRAAPGVPPPEPK